MCWESWTYALIDAPIVYKCCCTQMIGQSHMKVGLIIQMSNRHMSHPHQLSATLTSHVMKMDGT